MNATPFPTPDEARAQREAKLAPHLERLRQLVRETLSTKTPQFNGEVWMDMPGDIPQEACTIVARELADSGWTVRHEDSPRNESFWVIKPKG